MIKPGLQRISQLVNGSALPWKAVHVAGTNGKGTVCAATAALLTAARIRTGLFMSPHLLDRWDGIQVDGEAVSESAFRDAEARVAALDGAGAADRPSAFERLTATAFDVFSQRRVDVAVVETGMGGRFDATNVLQAPLVTVITKIGQDHQAFLDHTIEEIAWHKAGIMKPGVPCVLDGSSGEAAVDVVRRVAHKTGAGPLHVCGMRTEQGFGREQDVGLEPDLEPFQRANLSCALKAAEIVLAGLQPQTRSR